MATLNQNEIEDYSDLGQNFVFKYGDKYYSIPPIPPVTAKKLLKTSREFSVQATDRDKKIKEFEEENNNLPEDQKKLMPPELLEGAEGFYDFQVKFILTSGIIEVTHVDDILKKIGDVSEEIITNDWSTQLVMRIFKKINEIISIEQEKKS